MSNDPIFLDVEDDEEHLKRISILLERLNTTSPSRPSEAPNPLFSIGQERSPGSIEPPTELLERVQAFLPAISAANEALSQRNPADIDIENVAQDEAQYIQMNLGLGVLEAKSRPEPGSHSPHSSDAESTSDGTSESSESESDSKVSISSSDSDSDSDSSFDDDYGDSDVGSQSGSSVDMKPVSSRRIKPLPKRVSQQPITKLEV